jgi:RNA polymerase sigma factor for flagellar operon FliA
MSVAGSVTCISSDSALTTARTDTAVYPQQQLAVRNQLVMDHMVLVKRLAFRLGRRVPSPVEVRELMSVGMVGLIEAAGRYQAGLGVPFDAFVRQRVQGAMLDWLRKLDWTPRSARKLRRDVNAATTRLRGELQREPSGAEIAATLGVSEAVYDQMADRIRAAAVVMVRPLETGPGDSSVLDVALDPDEGVHIRLEQAEIREHLLQAIAELPERERQILSLYYQEERTLAEIGQVIGLGQGRVSQLRLRAITRLRTYLQQTLQLAEVQCVATPARRRRIHGGDHLRQCGPDSCAAVHAEHQNFRHPRRRNKRASSPNT